MLFEKTDGSLQKIKVFDPTFWTGTKWVTLKIGSQVDLSEDRGLRLGLKPVNVKPPRSVEKKADKGYADEESQEKASKLYKKALESIKGIGFKTAIDIINVYPTKADLIKTLEEGIDVPIRDDLAKILKEKFKR